MRTVLERNTRIPLQRWCLCHTVVAADGIRNCQVMRRMLLAAQDDAGLQRCSVANGPDRQGYGVGACIANCLRVTPPEGGFAYTL